MKKILLTISILVFTQVAEANLDKAWTSLKKSRGNLIAYTRVVQNLVNEKLYFAAIPYVKEYLTHHQTLRNRKMDYLIDEIITKVGVRQFEVLPTKYLLGSRSPMLSYILAKKYFRVGKYNRTLKTLNGAIPSGHPVKPYALLLEGSAFSVLKKQQSAEAAFRSCISASESALSSATETSRVRQLKMNRDYCILGIPRTQFMKGKYDTANLTFLDLEKSSYIWPEILFEEAWNSFYQRDYNRTLGKLVTYKAPVLSHVFNPEIEILRALTFLELCLWNDTKKVVDDFYDKYQVSHKEMKKFLRKHGKDYRYYYLLAKSINDGKKGGSKLLLNMMGHVLRDPAFIELYKSFHAGKTELKYVKQMKNKAFARILNLNLKESLLLQRNLIGAYVRKSLQMMSNMLDKNMRGMSYIKLEVISRAKDKLYDIPSSIRNRGDIKNLRRNDKQYFWTFNGEFWADELGDYVFSLKSECE